MSDLIIVGPSGADFGAKNWIGAFKLETGEPVWKFNLIPDAGEPGAETWQNPESLKHGGGSLWTPLSLDAKAGIVYLPVGNPAPDFYGEIRPGANLYTNSLVALDAKTRQASLVPASSFPTTCTTPTSVKSARCSRRPSTARSTR